MLIDGHIKKKNVSDKVLIIEGDSPLEERFVLSLIDSGFSVARISGYSQTLLDLNSLNPDIAILDDTLIDSLRVCVQLHTALGIPVVLVGRDSSQQIWQKAIVEAKADFYFKRPFSCKLFVTRIKAILRRHAWRNV